MSLDSKEDDTIATFVSTLVLVPHVDPLVSASLSPTVHKSKWRGRLLKEEKARRLKE